VSLRGYFFPALEELDDDILLLLVDDIAVDDLMVPARTAAPWGALVYVEWPRAMFWLQSLVMLASRSAD